MKASHPVTRLAVSALCFASIFTSYAGRGLCAELPQKDSKLPSFQLPSPATESDRQYLGLNGPSFQLKDIAGQVVLVEILGVYCPLCYQQAPLFNKLHGRIARKNLVDKVKMLGVAIGATTTEVEHLRKNGSYEYPIVQDESLKVHKLLGEPRTPFTLLVNREGKVLYTHLGVIEDVDALFQLIQDLAK